MCPVRRMSNLYTPYVSLFLTGTDKAPKGDIFFLKITRAGQCPSHARYVTVNSSMTLHLQYKHMQRLPIAGNDPYRHKNKQTRDVNLFNTAT